MSSSFFNSFKFLFILILSFSIILPIFFIPAFKDYSFETYFKSSDSLINNTKILGSNEFSWPVPGYTRISSGFGPRKAPTGGASTNHSGIDIPAPPGTILVSISDGKVTSTSWGGAGGYTVTINFGNITGSYCHVDYNFLVSPGEYVKKGQVIAKIGPLNVYNVPNNPYKDKTGKPTNGATTGPHLHLTIKKEGKAIDPLNILF